MLEIVGRVGARVRKRYEKSPNQNQRWHTDYYIRLIPIRKRASFFNRTGEYACVSFQWQKQGCVDNKLQKTSLYIGSRLLLKDTVNEAIIHCYIVCKQTVSPYIAALSFL